MLTHRSEFYLRKDFGFIDLGLNGAIDHATRDIYETLRRFVWRSEDTGHPEMRAMCHEGLLCARIAQATLGEYNAISRKHVNETIANLRRIGWIKVVSFVDKNVGTKAYVLGETVYDTVGRRHEVFYADGMLRDLWDTIEAKAKVKDGPDATPLTAFTLSERVELVKSALGQFAPMTSDEDPPLSPQVTGVVTYRLQGLSPTGYRGCNLQVTLEGEENTLKETKGEFQNTEAVPAAPLPFGDPIQISSETSSMGTLTSSGRSSRGTPTSSKMFAEPSSRVVAEPTTLRMPLSTEQLMLSRRAEELRSREDQMTASSAKSTKLANLKGRAAPASQRQGINRVEQLWRELYAEVYPNQKIAAWDRNGKERKNAESLINKYDLATTELALTYAVRQWERLQARRFKGVTLPSFGLIVAAHDTVFAEAQQYAQAMAVVVATRAIWEAGGMTASLTAQQQALYDRAAKDLKVMGHEV